MLSLKQILLKYLKYLSLIFNIEMVKYKVYRYQSVLENNRKSNEKVEKYQNHNNEDEKAIIKIINKICNHWSSHFITINSQIKKIFYPCFFVFWNKIYLR